MGTALLSAAATPPTGPAAGKCTTHNTTQHDTTQHNTKRHDTKPHRTTPHHPTPRRVTNGPSHPLCCRCLPCTRSPIPSILVPCSRCSGRLSCLAVPLLLVCCARPCPSWCGSRVLCVCVAPPPFCWRSWVPLSCTPSCPTRLPPRTRISHLHTTWTVLCAIGWSQPCCHPRGGHLPARGAQFPPLWGTWAPCRGRGGVFADGSLGVRRIC